MEEEAANETAAAAAATDLRLSVGQMEETEDVA
jgi:hypothetical protein